MKLHELRQRKAAHVAEARALLSTAETEKRQLNADEKARFDVLKATIHVIEGDEARAQFVEDAERRTAGVPVDKARTDLESRVSVMEAINAQVEGRALSGALAEFNQEQKRNGIQARGILVPTALFNETRAAQTTTTAAGIVPEDFRADQFVGLLRNSMVVRSLGARVLPNLRGDVVIPRQATSSTAQWLAEGDSLTDSGMTFNNITLKPKHVGAITELSRQLLQQSNPAIESLVRDDFINVVSLAVDKALIHGDGIKQPKGLLNSETGTGSLSTLNWANAMKLIEWMALKNVNPNAWLTHPEVATKLRTTLREAGLPGYLMEAGNLAGIPVAVTQQIEKKAGTPAKGRMILGDFSEMFVGTWGAVDILANQFAEGPYSRGAVQIRILTTMDMVPRREDAFVVVDDIAI
ncbi:phage major capsid protein [Malikia sp.]|uniref:phage major capsid protein n=1 Tax=Malikia sp. TaxID=2070706 RepID=UPI00261DA170|nr:phage major capsid protein [Malikia sp.]MDD2729732.1 phage major capsid protein [Malikia sp.]